MFLACSVLFPSLSSRIPSFRACIRSLPLPFPSSSVRIYNIIDVSDVSVSFPSSFPPNDFPRVLSCVTACFPVLPDFLRKKSLVLFARSA